MANNNTRDRMKTKIVYSVVCSEQDFYLEQTLMSVYTLRLHNKDANVSLVVDESTKDTIKGKRAEILRYIDEVISVSVPSNYSKVQRSRFLKTSLREHVKGDYLFVDSDTLITASLEEADNFQFEIGATADKHVNIGKHPMQYFLGQCSKVAGFTLNIDAPYFNSGVFYVKDTPRTHEFYREWHRVWQETVAKGINSDQASLAKTNEMMGFVIEDIGGEWNCQLTDNGLRFLKDARIIHYFASTAKKSIVSPYTFYQQEIYTKIKENGGLPEEIVNIITDPKKAFTEQCQIITKDDIPLMKSAMHTVYELHPKLFVYLNNIARLYLKL